MTRTLICDPYIKSVIKSLFSHKVSDILLKIRVRLKAVDVKLKVVDVKVAGVGSKQPIIGPKLPMLTVGIELLVWGNLVSLSTVA